MRKIRKNSFTLVEILVAMAVFSILLTLMVQFFASARTLWTANEKRTSVYADASIAMNLMATLLQTTFYTEGGMPFLITDVPEDKDAAPSATGWNSTLMFVSNSDMKLSDSGTVRYLMFKRGTGAHNDANPDNRPTVLQLRIFCDKDTNFSQCFQPFGVSPSPLNGQEDGARDCVNAFLSNTATDAAHLKPILRNVTGLKIIPVNCEGRVVYPKTSQSDRKGVVYDDNAVPKDRKCISTPVGVEIELSLMADQATAEEWAGKTGTDKDDFRTKNEYTFRRTVWLGDRTFNQ